jgi:hypothetical protein
MVMPETVASVLCKFMEPNYSRSSLHHGRKSLFGYICSRIVLRFLLH